MYGWFDLNHFSWANSDGQSIAYKLRLEVCICNMLTYFSRPNGRNEFKVIHSKNKVKLLLCAFSDVQVCRDDSDCISFPCVVSSMRHKCVFGQGGHMTCQCA